MTDHESYHQVTTTPGTKVFTQPQLFACFVLKVF